MFSLCESVQDELRLTFAKDALHVLSFLGQRRGMAFYFF